jgi:Ran GTPase-activating protein (RanGAP) involved in mRNA processing and transport
MAVRKKIVKLILGHNAVGQQSCSSLANLLMTSRTLEWLDCHWGHIRQDGAVELAEALVSAETLKHLDLGWNGFGDLVPCRCVDALVS